MKALGLIARASVLLVWVPLVWALWFYDSARESWKKRQLGDAYEGPAEE
jgi:hypothetical protein